MDKHTAEMAALKADLERNEYALAMCWWSHTAPDSQTQAAWDANAARSAATALANTNRRLVAERAGLVEALRQSIEESGYALSGPTDWRAAEDGEPKWVCNARAALAQAEGGA